MFSLYIFWVYIFTISAGGIRLKHHKYYEIYLLLKQKITDEYFKVGELLPSENALAQEFETSRETIRKALKYLSDDGLIQKQQGKGSIVLNPKLFNFPISGLTSFKELAHSQNMEAHTYVIKNERQIVDEALHHKLQLPIGQEVIAIERVREIDGQKVIYDYDYLNPNIVDHVPNVELENSLYNYLENELKLDISFANKKIVVEDTTNKDREHLDLRAEDNHLVVIRSLVYLDNAQYFQFSESRHRVDKFQFVDFSRRQHTLRNIF